MVVKDKRFDLSTFRSVRKNDRHRVMFGTSLYRYHTATYPPASDSANRRTNDTIFVTSIWHYVNRSIGCPVHWLTRSPDLALIASYEGMSNHCHTKFPEFLVAHIVAAVREVRVTLGIFTNVRSSQHWACEAFIMAQGRYFEHLL
ncbi:hypothetical protein TNCV_1577551 [Trichonephila clavipes]|nr:hypothetical protein TNCV_1577551 [Trichonephila clavipes]